MQNKIMQNTIWFLIITFAITYGLCLVIYLQGGLNASPLSPLVMFVPMLSAFFVQKVIAKEPIFKGDALGFRLGKAAYLFLSPAIILLIMTIIYAVTFALHPSLLVNEKGFMEYTSKSNLPISGSAVSIFLIIFSMNLILAPILNLPVLLGEEVGWRGFLYPNLIALYKKPGMIIGGVIWGLWHFPLILMGLNYPTNPILGLPFMIVLCIFGGIIFQYFYQKSGSIYTAGLAHGILNWTATTVTSFLIVTGKLNAFLEGPTGLIGLLIMGATAVYCYINFPGNG